MTALKQRDSSKQTAFIWAIVSSKNKIILTIDEQPQ